MLFKLQVKFLSIHLLYNSTDNCIGNNDEEPPAEDGTDDVANAAIAGDVVNASAGFDNDDDDAIPHGHVLAHVELAKTISRTYS